MRLLIFLAIIAGIYLNIVFVLHSVCPNIKYWTVSLNLTAAIAATVYLRSLYK